MFIQDKNGRHISTEEYLKLKSKKEVIAPKEIEKVEVKPLSSEKKSTKK